MWATVLVLALVGATDPVRMGVVLLLLSRPRPMRNLLTYWLGAMTIGVATALVLLLGMRDLLPTMMQNLAAMAAKPAARHLQLAVGLLLLPVAVSIAVGFSARRRAPVAALSGDTPAPAERPPGPIARAQNFVRRALQDGSAWVSFVVGLGSGPPPAECLAAFAVILASGTAMRTQVSAGITYIVVMLAVFEVTLISYVAAPDKTCAVVLRVHNWLRGHRRQIFACVIATLGVGLVSSGLGAV
ncbi:GAP family protein [Mycobacterium talmoniae]|uniref:Gap protein n=1 Tax=Mycobacterium talmoniae TaxID=1858794 RepID=A0A1S1NFR4_9MYCO|nr:MULTISPECIES: GAP family protein [Mycobacterium]OHV04531.1 hypothetical protein BKN37_09550 [Mycobacterium talmoniae]TDH57694.1 GAP family protein [Mycobacterium eburneum]